MIKFFSSLPIRVKIFCTAGVLVIALIGLGAFSFSVMKKTNAALSQLMQGPVTLAESVTKFSNAVASSHMRLYHLAATAASEDDPKKLAELIRLANRALEALPKWLEPLAGLRDVAGSESTFDDLTTAVAAYLKQAKNMVMMADKDSGSALMFLSSAERNFTEIDSLLSDARIATASLRDSEVTATSEKLDQQSTFLVIVSAIAIVVGSIMATLVATGIARPVVAIASTLRGIAGGNLSDSIPGQGRSDEIGIMATAVGIIKTRLLERDRLEHETAEIHRANAEKLLSTETAFRIAGKAQSEAVERIGEALDRLANGDVTTRVELFSTDYAKLADDFNKAAASLDRALTAVADSTASIKSGAMELHSASNDLAERTERQAATLEQTATALERINATVEKTAKGATHARVIVQTSKTETEKVGAVTRTATEAMGAIENSSKQISRIIGVIDEIAFQTNLLALNAGVEAARAGDAGRGFAVVASEVRALAQRSAEAAKEIKALIQTSTSHVDRGVSLVSETGRALERIAAQVTQINNVVAEIASGAQEQASGLVEVRSAISLMDQVTQQNAAMVEQSTAATHTLAEQTDDLVHLFSQFKLSTIERRRYKRDNAEALDRRPIAKTPAKQFPRSAMASAPKSRLAVTAAAVASRRHVDADWEQF